MCNNYYISLTSRMHNSLLKSNVHKNTAQKMYMYTLLHVYIYTSTDEFFTCTTAQGNFLLNHATVRTNIITALGLHVRTPKASALQNYLTVV